MAKIFLLLEKNFLYLYKKNLVISEIVLLQKKYFLLKKKHIFKKKDLDRKIFVTEEKKFYEKNFIAVLKRQLYYLYDTKK